MKTPQFRFWKETIQELEARLSGRETLPVLVELQKETDREENDARRESRGRGLFDESAQW